MTKQKIISSLGLKPHPSEGGYFKRTYTSKIETSSDSGTRKTLSCIYYMLTNDSPTGYLHRNKSDIIHYFHSGSPISYLIIHPDGHLETQILGNDLTKGHNPQLTVNGGCWKASKLTEGEYSLLSEAVSPGFEYEDMELARPSTIKQHYPGLFESIQPYIKPQTIKLD
ncbi:MAG: cupin domain-containing protein [Gammaproteobacteria bacterium]|nr:cupin domain-containing protein [Gammaproteobacteria bacterium]MCW8923982.1 cupin domain-containing protein [Gammaproteobacteria bacterium]